MGSSHSSENDHAAQAFADFMGKHMSVDVQPSGPPGLEQCGPFPDGPAPLDSAMSIDKKHCCHFTPAALKAVTVGMAALPEGTRANPDAHKGVATMQGVFTDPASYICTRTKN